MLSNPTFDPDNYRRLCAAREFIDQCYAYPLNLDQISSQAFFSRYHFIRLFRQAFHKTPHQYLIHERIEKAKELLVSTELPVTEVCLEVGFQSLGSFSSLFRKCVGDSPLVYRTHMYQPKYTGVHFARVFVPACFLLRFGGQKRTTH